jgi:hypothetical protein
VNTLWNILLIIAGSAIAVGGIFGEGYDRAKLAQTKWWKPHKYITARGWIMLSLTTIVIATSVWKYHHDLREADTKEHQFAAERDHWKKIGEERTKSMQDKLDMLSAENGNLRSDIAAERKESNAELATLKTKSDAIASHSEALRKQLEDLKARSEDMVLATTIAGSTTSASVLKASGDLKGEIQASASLLGKSAAERDDALLRALSDMREKDITPLRIVLDSRGHAESELPTLHDVREECASPAELETVLKSPAAKNICPACICTCTQASSIPPALTASATDAPNQ